MLRWEGCLIPVNVGVGLAKLIISFRRDNGGESSAIGASANGVAAAIEVRPGSVKEASGTYELVVVNVTIDIHESIAADFRRHLVARQVIVAGLLAGPQEQRVAGAYDAEVVERRQQGEWVSLVLHLHDALPSDR